jgi:hypothetical protein
MCCRALPRRTLPFLASPFLGALGALVVKEPITLGLDAEGTTTVDIAIRTGKNQLAVLLRSRVSSPE